MSLRASVIVCTRNRAADLERCLHSLQIEQDSWYDLIIVDQSDGYETEELVNTFARTVSGVRYVRSTRRGLSAARNDGARASGAELLLFTDDDCEVQARWVNSWLRVFEQDPTLGVGFGSVSAPPFDPRQGHTPNFRPEVESCTLGLQIFDRGASAIGMGANMALTGEAWKSVGGYDEGLGAGSQYPGAEELDLAYRLLNRGYRLFHLRRPAVIHNGFRPSADAKRLFRGYVLGTAAMYVKHVRYGDTRAARLLAAEATRGFAIVLSRAARGQRPLGLHGLLAFLTGAFQSWRQPMHAEGPMWAVDPSADSFR